MNTITEQIKATVCEGYQVLLRAEAELVLPEGKEFIGNYYRLLSDKCMHWATEVLGERIRREFLKTEDLHDRALWRAQKYRFVMRIPWSSEQYAAVLCESYLLGQRGSMQNSYHRHSHVWNLDEESILPPAQILQLFGGGISMRELPLVPDGIYPEGGDLILYKNPTATSPWEEYKSPLGRQIEKKEQ